MPDQPYESFQVDRIADECKKIQEESLATHTCPFCAGKFTPKYSTKAAAMLNGDAEAREQWISGCCSTICWNTALGPEQ